ncbi:MAG TPA: hypothetical protein VKA60_13040 [Blastocatellia bacterium]|nr:hypothetical protein [Blastocatellia bacterium]
MAVSTINTECKRYGCMKNLLACFANCRYVGRCDELRNELSDKTAQAESDINRYLSERGRPPVLVQILKRGVKFDDKSARAPRQAVKPAALRNLIEKPAIGPPAKVRPKVKLKTKPRAARRPAGERPIALPVTTSTTAPRAALRLTSVAPQQKGGSRSKKRNKMPRRVKTGLKAKAASAQTSAAPLQETPTIMNKPAPAPKPASKRAAPRQQTAAKPRKGGGKVYIIIEGQTASIVDEQGLMAHLFGNHSKNARYFEASEVEARLQIVPKR